MAAVQAIRQLQYQAIPHLARNRYSQEYWEHRPTPQLRLIHYQLATHRKTQKLVQAMRSILVEEPQAVSTAEVLPTESELAHHPNGLLFDLAPFTDKLPTKKKSRKHPDVVLNRQTTLFD